jgi:hypothetical protein
MKAKLITCSVILLLTLFFSNANAQHYCFWIANQSTVTFAELKMRVHGSGISFGPDLLPEEYIQSGHHFWVRTANNGEEMWDVQITRMDGSPLLFSYTDRGGTKHINQRFITVNARNLHTLVIDEDSDGYLTFGYYTDDQLAYGDPCNN